MYPLGNVSPSIYRATLVGTNVLDPTGARIDFNASANDQIFARYSYSGGHNINPISVRGTDVPGFPTRDDLSTHAATVSDDAHLLPGADERAARDLPAPRVLLRPAPEPDAAVARSASPTPRPTTIGQGPPFFNVSGYTPIGGAITGPRNTKQNTFEVQDGVTWTRGSHMVKVGGEIRHTGIDMVQAIAPNAFYVFAGTFPTNNAVANLLLGAPVTFYQGLGDFTPADRACGASAPTRRTSGASAAADAELRPALRAHQSVHRGRGPAERLRARPEVDGAARRAGRARVSRRRRHRPGHRAQRQRLHAARRRGLGPDAARARWSVRASYGLFYDQFQNGAGTASQVAISATPWAQFNQFSGAGLNFQNPYRRRAAARGEHVRPAVHGLRARRGGEAAARAELERRACSDRCSTATSRKSATSAPTGRNLPAQRRGQPGGLRSRRDGAERGPPPHLRQLPRRRRHLRFLHDRDAEEHHPIELPRRCRRACRAASAAASASTRRTGILADVRRARRR